MQSPSETSIANTKMYRIEEVPLDEAQLQEDEMLIPVAHFFKDVYSMFGVPFLVRTRQGEPFGALKERVRKKLAVPEKEWEKVGERELVLTGFSAEVCIKRLTEVGQK